MGTIKEIPFGTKYGKLEVLSEEPHTYHPNGKMKRLVKVGCDCGEIVVKAWQDVKSGAQKSCGLCKKTMPVKDIAGKQVYNLKVTSNYITINNNSFWECECKCGRTVTVDGRKLREDRVRNCGECGTPLGSYYWGDKITNFEGYEFTLIKIENRIAVLEDQKGQRFEVNYGYLKKGNFCYPYHPSVAGVGYYGVGRYVAKSGGDKHTEEYENWNSMMKRCYVSNKHVSSYHDKSVCDGWHNFQSFAEWATNQVGFNQGYHLDKDLLKKGNLVYGPDTCVYLPPDINSFIRRKRMNDLPLGVDIAYNYDGTPYFRTQGREGGKNIVLGRFYKIEDAFFAYKQHKEMLAKELAEKWKNKIDPRAYQALINYTVEITD